MEERFNLDDIREATNDLATMPYFPHESRSSVMNFLAEACPHKRALHWLAKTATARCKQWPGLSELRGLLCTRFDAADGIDEPDCSIPGFAVEDAYSRSLRAHCQVTGKSEGYERVGLDVPLNQDTAAAVRGDGGYIADESRRMLREARGNVRQIRSAQ